MKLLLILNTITVACVSAFVPIISPHTKSQSSTSVNMTWRDDNIVTLVPKFKIKEGKKDAYMAVLPKFQEKVKANEQDVGDKTQRGHDRKPTYAEIARRTPTRQAI